MWYMCWVLGILLACALSVIYSLWLEYTERLEPEDC